MSVYESGVCAGWQLKVGLWMLRGWLQMVEGK